MTDTAPSRTRVSRPRREVHALVPVAAVLLLVELVAAAVLLGVRDHDRRRDLRTVGGATPAQAQALAAARAEAVALTTLGYRTASHDLDRVLAGATGKLHARFERERRQLPATLARNRSTSRGMVLSSGLASLTATTARAVLAVDATVSGSDVGGSGVLKHYRMVIDLRDVGGRWLASDVSFAGVPQ